MKRVFNDIDDFGDDDDSDETSQNENPKKFFKKIRATIFLVDARKKMFLPSFEEEQLPFMRCMECVRNVIRNKIFCLEKGFCSIILLGTKKNDNPLKLNNISVIHDLDPLGAEHVKKVDEIIRAVENSSYEKEYDYKKFSLADAFWLSAHMFNSKSSRTNKTIMLFTNDDNPVGDDKNESNRALSLAQDMYRNFISFELIQVGEDFDINKFYKKIMQASRNDVDCTIPAPVTKISEMLNRAMKTNYRHVNLVKLPFAISDDFKIGVTVHYLVRKVKIPFKVKLSKSTNERVTTKMQLFELETGSLVKQESIIKSQSIGQKDINFSPAELKKISEIGKLELRLLGFKPASCIGLENFVKPCAFIYPDESTYKGSSLFFTALLKRCIAKQVAAICTFCPRTTSACRFVALIAQDEYLHSERSQELPPGFVVFFLPFAEELRTFDEGVKQRAEPEQVEIAMKLIKKLKFKYKVDCFKNPKLRTHWAAIEALALDLKEAEEVNDSTVPNYELISRRTGEIVQEFMSNVYEDDYDPEYFAAPKKQKPVKKAIFESNVEDVEDLIRHGSGEQLTNDVLKNYLTSVGLGKGLSKMKKADLLEKVRSYLNLE